MSLLAIDIGSSRCKAVVFTGAGDILDQDMEGYAAEFSLPTFAQMDPEKFWEAVCRTTRAVTKNIARDGVKAVCLSSHGETFVPVDARGRAIAPAILNQDSRATAEAAWLEQELGRKRLFDTTGLVAHPMYPIPKLIWLRRHHYDLFNSASRFVSVTDYILLRLGLPPYIDYSLASRFLAFDIRRRRWSDEILAAAGLCADQLPIPVPAGSVAGRLNVEAAVQLGVDDGTLMVVGGHDQPCGALGAGVIAPGRVYDSMGTYECVTAASEHPCAGEEAFAAALNSYCHVVPDKFVTLAYFPSGIMLKWFHDLLYANGKAQADDEAKRYEWLEARAPAEPTGLCITPHLIGTCNPDFNPRARGTIFGLSPGTSRAEIYKGILEGLACELAQMLELLAKAVGEVRDVYVTGGGTRSRLGLRLRAALTGRRLHVLRCQESVCLGGAILGGVAAGEYANVADGVEKIVRESAIIEPDPELGKAYVAQSKQYRLLYSALAPVRESYTL